MLCRSCVSCNQLCARHHEHVPQIHDELLFEVEEGALPAAAALVRQCMEGAVTLQVPLPVRLSGGASWGRLSPYEP